MYVERDGVEGKDKRISRNVYIKEGGKGAAVERRWKGEARISRTYIKGELVQLLLRIRRGDNQLPRRLTGQQMRGLQGLK